jgi:hypothetical protein
VSLALLVSTGGGSIGGRWGAHNLVALPPLSSVLRHQRALPASRHSCTLSGRAIVLMETLRLPGGGK